MFKGGNAVLVILRKESIFWLFTLFLLVVLAPCISAKSGSTWYTEEMRSNALRNSTAYPWSRQIRDSAVRGASRWAQMSDEELWHLVPPATLPRPSSVNWGGACPSCGEDMTRWGFYYLYDIINEPWKVRCPSCRRVFPSNDFGTYYKSGIGSDGQFHRELADKSLLYNTEHPDPKDPLHKKFVDDGTGWVDEKRIRYNFIGQYVWGVWTEIFKALEVLGDAYLYTGDKIYAHKAAILLDRIADLYPEMDIKETVTLGSANDGGSGRGKLFGQIAETFNIRYFARAYDIIYDAVADDTELHNFLREKAEEFQLPTKKGSPELFCANIEERILREGAEAIIRGDILGNMGMHQYSMGVVAVVYDKEPYTSQWLDWIFKSHGGKTDEIIIARVDRDGYGDESGLGYASSWLENFMSLADLLKRYRPGSEYDLYTRYGSKFERWYHTGFALLNGRQGGPGIGDSDKCGNPGSHGDVNQMIKAFELFGTPRFAQIAYWASKGNLNSIHSDIFHPEPQRIVYDICMVINEYGDYNIDNVNLGGYGYSVLRSGDVFEGNFRALWMYYGRNNTSHAHKDRLNLGLIGFDLDLMPDLGYPERTGAWPKRLAWTSNTISHNTVVVDQLPQQGNWGGRFVYFIGMPGMDVMEVDGNTGRLTKVYPSTDTYIRTSSLIDISDKDFYVVDIFRVRGGNDHIYSFHGAEGQVRVEGLNLVKQPKGTYYGAGTEFAADIYGDYRASRPGQGFQYLHSVQKGKMTGDAFSVEYDIIDTWGVNTPRRDIKLRLTGLGDYDSVDLAVGDPPQISRNPEHLQYVLIRNTKEPDKPGLIPSIKKAISSIVDKEGYEKQNAPLETRFVTVIEAYEGERVVKDIKRLKTTQDSVTAQGVAIKVEVPGRTDYILSSLDPEVEVKFEGGIEFKGRYGLLSFQGDEFIGAKLMSTSYVKIGDITYKNPNPEYKGKILDFDKGMVMESKIYVDIELPDTVIGLQIHIKNDGERDASYKIESVKRIGDKTEISIGNYSLVRGFENTNDPFGTLIYNIKEDDGFYIPLPLELMPKGIIN
jgi:hypothetical protein